MNIAIIFAGGSGQRMNSEACPKQFLKLNGKPIIIYTLELFNNHPEIDAIVISCIAEWIPYLKKCVVKYELAKVSCIVPGGSTGQESIYNALKYASENYPEDSAVLLHDGVRPLIRSKTISDNIRAVEGYGNAVTCSPTSETFVILNENEDIEVPPRERSYIARAPQSFVLRDIWAAHCRAVVENRQDFIDSCSMMTYYGHKMHIVIGPGENIKITTPADFYIFRTMLEIRENYQIFGLKI